MSAKKPVYDDEEPELANKLRSIIAHSFNPNKKSRIPRRKKIEGPLVTDNRMSSKEESDNNLLVSCCSSSRNNLLSNKASFLLDSGRIDGVISGKLDKQECRDESSQIALDSQIPSKLFRSRYESNTFKNLKIAVNDEAVVKEKPRGLSFIKRIKLVNGFIWKLRDRSVFRSAKFISDPQINLIHDLAHFPEKANNLVNFNLIRNKNGIYYFRNNLNIFLDRFRGFGNMVCHKTEQIFQKWIPTIRPNGKTKIVWDAFITLFIVIKFFLIPIEIGFGIKLHLEVDEKFGLMNFITSLFFLCDIPLKFNTGFYHNGNVVIDKAKILRHYLKSYFIFDLLASVHSCKYIYEYITTLSDKTPSSVPWLNIFFFVKLVELLHLISNFEELLYLDEKIEMVYELIKLIIQAALFTHLIACVWHAVGYFNKTSINWLEISGLRAASWQERYLYSLNWAASSLLLTSYGEKITPTNNIELISGILLHFLSAGGFCLIVKTMLAIFGKLNKKTKTLKRSIRILNRFMSRKNLNYELQDRARKYLNFAIRELQNENSQMEQDVVNKLSYSLKEEVLLQTNGSILRQSPIFRDNFSRDFLKKLIFKMQKISFMPEEIIYMEKESKGETLYFLLSGSISLYQESKKKLHSIALLSKGETFGEKEFFTGSYRETSAKSKSFSTAFVISKADFLEILLDFPLDMEKFCLIRDELSLNNKSEKLSLKCFVCNNQNHHFIECSKIRYMPPREVILARYQFSKPQERIPVKRKRPHKFNSRKNYAKINAVVQDMLLNASFLDDQLSNSFSFTHSLERIDNNILDTNTANPNIPSIERPASDDATPASKHPRPMNMRVISEIEENDMKMEPDPSLITKAKLELFQHSLKAINEKKMIAKLSSEPNFDLERIRSEKKATELFNHMIERNSRKNYSVINQNKSPNTLLIPESFTQFTDNMIKINELNIDKYNVNEGGANNTKRQNTKIKAPTITQYDNLDHEEFNIFIMDFDVMKNFHVYFPSGNADQVVEKINEFRRKKKKRKKKINGKVLDESLLSPALMAKYRKSRINFEIKNKILVDLSREPSRCGIKYQGDSPKG